MLAARDQENAVHARQRAATCKPLNQDPKTPGPPGALSALAHRTKARRNATDDENSAPSFTGKKNTAVDKKAAFVTSAPSIRAPLGAKTTNTRARPLQTPGSQSAKPQIWTKTRQPSANARRPKLKVHHQSEEDVTATHLTKVRNESDTDSVPDVETCPSKVADLPDYPDPDDSLEIKPDEDFSMFSKQNYFRGVWDVYGQKGSEGLTNAERCATSMAYTENYLDEQSAITTSDDILETEHANDRQISNERELDRKCTAPPTRAFSHHNKFHGDALSRDAAAVLSNPGTISTARYAQPTVATQARNPSKTTRGHNNLGSGPSKNTIGYSQGRKISAAMNKGNGRAEERKRDDEPVGRSGEELLEDLCRRQLDEEHHGTDIFDSHLGIDFDPLALEFKDFQLEVP